MSISAMYSGKTDAELISARRRKIDAMEEAQSTKPRRSLRKRAASEVKSSKIIGTEKKSNDKSRDVKMEEKLSREAREYTLSREGTPVEKGGTVHRITVTHRIVVAGPPLGLPRVSLEVDVQRDLRACLSHYTKVFREVRAVFSKGTYLGPKSSEPSQYSGLLAFLKEGDPGKVTDPINSIPRYSAWCDFDQESTVSFVTWNGRVSYVDVAKALSNDSLFVPSIVLSLFSEGGLPASEIGEVLVVTALEFRGNVSCTVTSPLQYDWRCYGFQGEEYAWQAPSDTTTDNLGLVNPCQDDDDLIDIESLDLNRTQRDPYPTIHRKFRLTNKSFCGGLRLMEPRKGEEM